MLLFSFYIISSNSNAEDACSNDISQFEQESAEGPLDCRECQENVDYNGDNNGFSYNPFPTSYETEKAESGYLFYCFPTNVWDSDFTKYLYCLAAEVGGGGISDIGGGLSGYGGGVAVLQEANNIAVPVNFGGGDLQVLNEYDGGGLSEVVGDEQEAEETVGSGAGSSFKVGTGSW